MNYKVTVIIPCYNLEKYINECVLSICNQSYKNLEIIIVNDGSTDGSWTRIKELETLDSRIKGINQANGGVSKARNAGIIEATGDMLMFVDGDDTIDSTYIENMIHAMDDKTDLVVAGITFKHKDHDIIINGDVFSCDANTFFQDFYLGAIVKRTIFGPVNKLFKREIIVDHNIKFLENIAIREDGLFVLEFLKQIQYISSISDAGYNYIQHDIGSSLVGKYHDNELEINAHFYKELLSLVSNSTNKFDVVSQINPMFLNMDFTSIMKFYTSKEYSFGNGINYINRVKRDEAFRKARKELFEVHKKRALKYYRPTLVIHLICFVKQIKQKKGK